MVSRQSPVTWEHPGWVTGPKMVRVRAPVGKGPSGGKGPQWGRGPSGEGAGCREGKEGVQRSSHSPSLPPWPCPRQPHSTCLVVKVVTASDNGQVASQTEALRVTWGPLRADMLIFRVQEPAVQGDSPEPLRVELTIHNSCSDHCLASRMFQKRGISISVHQGQRPPALWTTDLCFPALQAFPSEPHRATTWCLP